MNLLKSRTSLRALLHLITSKRAQWTYLPPAGQIIGRVRFLPSKSTRLAWNTLLESVTAMFTFSGGTSVAGSQSAGAVLDAASVPNRVAPAAVLPLVPTGSVVAAPPVVTVKRGAVKPVSAPTLRPAASTTNAATSRSVPVTSILTLQPAPKPPSVVPRTLVTSVPSQSAFLKMIPVTGVTASTTAIMHPSSPVYLSSGQASATSSIGALTRPVSPLKSVAPVKTVTQPGRAIAKMGE